MDQNFTEDQYRILLELLRREARRLGYGPTWNEENYTQWPPRLKQLRRTAMKLVVMRETIK